MDTQAPSDQTVMALPGDKVTVKTPEGYADIYVVPVRVVTRLLIRGARAFLTTTLASLGLTTASTTLSPIPIWDFSSQLYAAAAIGATAFVVSILINLLIILIQLDDKYPSVMS